MADVRFRPLTELDIEAVTRIDETVTGKYRPDVWEQRIGYYEYIADKPAPATPDDEG